VTQSSGSGALTADIEAISPGIARIEASADFDLCLAVLAGFL
jgi:hypothetical protein